MTVRFSLHKSHSLVKKTVNVTYESFSSRIATGSQKETLVAAQHTSNCDSACRQLATMPLCRREERAKVSRGGEEEEGGEE